MGGLGRGLGAWCLMLGRLRWAGTWWASTAWAAVLRAAKVACGLVIEPEPEPESLMGLNGQPLGRAEGAEGSQIPKMGTKNSIGTSYEKARKRLVAGLALTG